MMNDIVNDFATKILNRKFQLQGDGFTPRLVLLNSEIYDLLVEELIQSYKELPWGDSLIYELSKREDKSKIFLADGSLYGLWVVKVDTVKEFEVY